MSTEKTPLTLAQRISALLKAGDEGKINSFFIREKKTLQKDIDKAKKNKLFIASALEEELDTLKDKIEDANQAVESAYEDITAEQVKSNAEQDRFSPEYWGRITSAENVVEALKKKSEAAKDSAKDKTDELDRQIDKLQNRIDIIDGKRA